MRQTESWNASGSLNGLYVHRDTLSGQPPTPSWASLDSGLLEFFCLSPPPPIFFLIEFFRIPTYLHYFYLNPPFLLSAAAVAVLLPVHLSPTNVWSLWSRVYVCMYVTICS